MDMHFYWLHDRCGRKIHVYCKQVKHNLDHYPSKHHSKRHNISVLPTYLLNNVNKQISLFKSPKLPATLQGCVQTQLSPTFEQPLDCKSPMSPVSVLSVLNQRHHLTRQHFHLSKTDCPKPPAWTNSFIRT